MKILQKICRLSFAVLFVTGILLLTVNAEVTINSPGFSNSSGAITDGILPAGNVNVSVAVSNDTTESASAMLVAVLSDSSNRVVAIYSDTCTLNGITSDTLSTTVSVPADKNGYKLNAFVQDNMTNARPYGIVGSLEKKSGQNSITGARITAAGVDGIIDEVNKEIVFTVASNVDLSATSPEFTVSEGATVSPAAAKLGKPVKYTVTAANGDKAYYTVRTYYTEETLIQKDTFDYTPGTAVIDASTKFKREDSNTSVGSFNVAADPLRQQGNVMEISKGSGGYTSVRWELPSPTTRPVCVDFKMLVPTPQTDDSLRGFGIVPSNGGIAGVDFRIATGADGFYFGYRTDNDGTAIERAIKKIDYDEWHDVRIVYETWDNVVSNDKTTSKFELWVDGEKLATVDGDYYGLQRTSDNYPATQVNRVVFQTASWSKGKIYLDDLYVYTK